MEETTYRKIKKHFPVPPEPKYKPNDVEEVLLMDKWETKVYNEAAKKKCNTPRAVGVLRKGSRVHSEKLYAVHLPTVFKLMKVLLETKDMILTIRRNRRQELLSEIQKSVKTV